MSGDVQAVKAILRHNQEELLRIRAVLQREQGNLKAIRIGYAASLTGSSYVGEIGAKVVALQEAVGRAERLMAELGHLTSEYASKL